MTQGELKARVEELVGTYFRSATIVWSRTKAVRAHRPLVVLTPGSIIRPYQPVRQVVNGVPVDCYPTKTTVQVDLYTKGARAGCSDGVLYAAENTAVTDLTEFVNFLNSAYVDDWGDAHDVSILANQVHDLSQLIGDVSWDYRAMVELEIGFTQNAVGYAGLGYENGIPHYENGTPKYDGEGYPLDETGARLPDDGGYPFPPEIPAYTPTASGGGTQELADGFVGWYEQVETEYEQEEPRNGQQT